MKNVWLALILVLSLSGVAHAQPKHRSKSDLQSSLAKLQKKKRALAAELKRTNRRANAVVADIAVVDHQIIDTQAALDKTTERLEDSKTEQRSLGERLKSASAQLEVTRQQVRARISHIYTKGPNSVLSALISTKSVGDVASRSTVMEMIARQDRDLFNRYQKLKSEVSDAKRRQDRVVARVSDLKKQQENQQSQLQDLRENKKDVLAGLRSRQGEIKKALAQFEADESNIAAQIAAYNRRVKSGNAGPALPTFTGRFGRPINARITSGFGMRYHPIIHKVRLHAGIDFGAHIGTTVVAAADGRVVATGYGSGFGNRVIIDHGGGVMTIYGHLSRFRCSPGQMVHKGEPIAASGNSGLSTGPHLHFEVRVNGNPVNPLSRF